MTENGKGCEKCDRFGQRLDDENCGNESRENFFGEIGEELDDGRSLESGHEKSDDQSPDADPNPPGKKFDFVTPRKSVQRLFV